MFYARECRYGLNVVWQNHDGSTDSLPGVFVRFPSRAARDAWVSADPYAEGRAVREAVTRAQIEPKLRYSARQTGVPLWDDPEGVGIDTLTY